MSGGLTMTDLFCGAGGSSTGAIAVPGVQVRVASNHWQLAVDTHNSNHPNTDHVCADLSQINPRYFPRTDLLWASPECTNHSNAKGIKRDKVPDLFGEVLPDEAAERSRATMWDVPRFAEHHRYRGIVVENVVEAYRWQPFQAWLMAMDSLGYEHRIVYLNSMHAQRHGLPAPQSRDRMYVVFWRSGEKAPDLDTRPQAVCPTCGPVRAVQAWKQPDKPRWGRYRAQYVWRCPNITCRNTVVEPGWLPAATVIDWTNLGVRIGDRDRPLAAKTMARIEAALRKYGARMPQLVPAGGTWNNDARPVSEPLRARATRETEGILVPVEGRDGKRAQPDWQPLRTMTTRNETGLLITLRGQNAPKTTGDVFDTFAASGFHHALVYDYNGPTRTAHQVLPTQTTVEGNAVVAPAVAVEDCRFRMLEPAEIARGMAFPTDYTILGNRREQVRQAGNAVTPPAARDLIAALAGAITRSDSPTRHKETR